MQYKWFTLYLHRDVSHTDMLNPHFISCRGVSGAGGNMRESRIFCQFYLVLSLFYSLQRGSNGFIAEKTLLILYQECKGVHYFPGGGGVKLFPGGGGPNASFFRIVSEYDQQIPQSQTADNPVAPRGRAAQPSQDTKKTN